MPKTLQEKMAELEPKRRAKIEKLSAELIAREMTIRELRKQLQLSQEKLAAAMKITQDSLSRLEKRADFKVSTVRSCVEAMGGELHMICKFPKQPLIELTGFTEQQEEA